MAGGFGFPPFSSEVEVVGSISSLGSRLFMWPGSGFLHACKLSCFSRVRLFVTLWTVAHQSPPSMGFSRQEYWSGVPSPSLTTNWKPPKREKSGTIWLHWWILSVKDLPHNTQTLPKIEEGGTLPNSSHEFSITLVQKPDTDTIGKENYRISLMKFEVKILNKILANQIQDHIKRIKHNDQTGFLVHHN